jgi:hypothetical protein
MPEMKESANIKEEEHLKELLSRVEKEQPLKAETIIDKILPTKLTLIFHRQLHHRQCMV